MQPDEIETGELFMMNENGKPVKIGRFSELKNWEIKVDPKIDLKKLYETKYEATFELTPESEAQLAELQKKLDAEIIENLKQQIKAVDDVIMALKCCEELKRCPEHCPYYHVEEDCSDKMFRDATAIAEAYKRVVESGLMMMEKR